LYFYQGFKRSELDREAKLTESSQQTKEKVSLFSTSISIKVLDGMSQKFMFKTSIVPVKPIVFVFLPSLRQQGEVVDPEIYEKLVNPRG